MANELNVNDAAEQLTGLFDEIEQADDLEELPGTEEIDPDEVEEEEEEEVDEAEKPDPKEPDGQKYLTVVGDDGKPHRLHIDKLLSGTTFDVKVDGEIVHVPYEELKNGYSRQADYTRKTTELAKKEAELAPLAELVAFARKDPLFAQHAELYFKTGGAPPDMITQARPDVTERQLAEAIESPDEKVRQEATKIMKARADLRQYHERLTTYKDQVESEKRALLARHREVEAAKLREYVPDYEEKKTDLKNGLSAYRVNDEEIANLVDHRIVRLVNDAIKLKAAVKADVKAGVKTAQSAPRIARNATQSTTDRKRGLQQQKVKLARARQTQSLDDWAEALQGLV